jgi:putrescine aminotransferase
MTASELLAAYSEHGNPYIARAIEATGAIVVTSARSATLSTSAGEVVDLASGGFGYGHPLVLERVAAQIEKMPLSSRVFFSRPLAELVRRLAEVTPDGLEVSFVSNAGAEALEGALKLVKGFHRKRQRVIAMKGAFHGGTTSALAVSGIDALRGRVQSPLDVSFVPYGDADAACVAIDERTSAVVVEPVSVGVGVRVPPPGYLRKIRQRCTETGALLVVDEVTTGLGRTGTLWGVDHDRISPDIMVVAGALGAGVLPVAAYVARKSINDRVYDKRDPLLHANTTGGNPTACVAALTALELIETEGLAARAAAHGARVVAALEAARPNVLEVVGKGLLAAARVRDAAAARAIQREALSRGVLVRADGIAGGEAWIGVRPPLIATTAEVERGLAALEAALSAVARNGAQAREGAVA